MERHSPLPARLRVTESSVPFLCWIKKTRWLGMFVGFALHAGIAVTTDLGLFSLAMLPLYLSFLDGDDLARLRRMTRQGR